MGRKRKSSSNRRRKDRTAKRKARGNEVYRMAEKVTDAENKRVLRQDEDYARTERILNAATHHEQRNSPTRSAELKFASWDRLLTEYDRQINDGPTHICASCGGLWFARSMASVVETLQRKGCNLDFMNMLFQVRGDSESFELCGTCHGSAIKKQMPRKNLANGFRYPDLPPLLRNLTQLEERLVSPRIPFMQLRTVGTYQQKCLRGNIVNVPNDMDICSKTLPRKFNDTSIVPVMLMRRMCYKSAYLHENIRPNVVYEAAKLLCESELYKSEDIALSEDWIRSYHGETTNFVIPELSDRKTESSSGVSTDEFEGTDSTSTSTSQESESQSSEDEEERVNAGADETLITDACSFTVKIAPGEGQKPLGLIRDINAEQLSFPSIFGGVPRTFKNGLKISLVDIQRSQARMFDRRGVTPTKILYSAKLLQNKCVADQALVCREIKKILTKSLTAGEVRDKGAIEKLVSHDDGFRCLRNVRTSPAYWQNEEKKIMAMIRQTFIPTLFITNSAAETKWPELLTILELIHNQRNITEEEAMNLTFHQKATLIRADPCVCALYFDHRFRSLLNLILNKPNGAFGPYKVIDFYNKVEFAHRGSAHNHGIYWLEDAPTYNSEDEASVRACIEFIDQFITCRRLGDEELEQVIGFQIHRHTHTCKRRTRNGKFRCRFHLPLPPMPETMILQPLLKDDPKYDKAQENFDKMQIKLNEMGRKFLDDIPFETFVDQLSMTLDEYFQAVRSSITRDKVFLKRKTCDIFVNAYNEKILKAWRANMDIQFILNPYSCAKYCISYLTKSCSGMSKLMRDVERELRKGNQSLQQKMYKIFNTFLNFSEISAQEAAYLVLGLSLTLSSRDDVFINTGLPDERVSLLKSSDELEELEEKSNDIFVHGLIERYGQRPTALEEICLAEFASMYTFNKGGSDKNNLRLLDGSGVLTRRTKARIIRYRRYNIQQDKENYYREQLLLYVPWRKESDFQKGTFQEQFVEEMSTVTQNRQDFDPRHQCADIEDLASNVKEDIERQKFDDEEIEELHPDYETDIADSIGERNKVKKFDFLTSPRRVPDHEYVNIVRTLNCKQRMYFHSLVHKLKTGQVPTYDFISGQAGTGKTHSITAIVQFVTRYFGNEVGIDLENLLALILAPTGKVAFNDGGYTMHCALRLPPNNYYGALAELSEDICNSLRVKLKNLKIVIIDEISMCSLVKFHEINARLQQIFQSRLPFGGISMVVVGDFYQIRPVQGQFVFEIPRNAAFGYIMGPKLWRNFKMYELTEIMRQKTALKFAKALNNMGLGAMTDEDIALIRSREIGNGLTVPNSALHLFWSNAECQELNKNVHNSLDTEHATSYAVDTVQGYTSEKQRENFLDYLKRVEARDADGFPTEVRLQVGGLHGLHKC